MSSTPKIPEGGQAIRQETSAPGDASGGTRVSDSPGVVSTPSGFLAAVRDVLDDFDNDRITLDTAIARLRVITNPNRLLVHEVGIVWLHGDSSIPLSELRV